MKLTEPALAKSLKNGGISLVEHSRQVISAILHLAERLGMDSRIARAGGALHDCGKAHPRFQSMLQAADRNDVFESSREKLDWSFAHRHEFSSLLLLPCFPKTDWPILIELVIAHHKSLEEIRTHKGFLDIAPERRAYANHSREMAIWLPTAVDMLRELGYDASIPTPEACREAWDYALEYAFECAKQYSWSRWRGLLMAADHFASAMGARTYAETPALFRTPDLSIFRPDRPGGVLFPLTDLPVNDPRPHTLVVAPTGAGKTNFLMRRCEGRRVFYTLPFQASINAMWHRFRSMMPGENVRFQHASSALELKKHTENALDDELPLHGLPGASVKVMTPHQMAAIILGLPGYESVLLDFSNAAVILDEIHTYADVSRSMVLEIVRVLLTLNCSIHIGTATMPTAMYNELLELLGGPVSTYEVRLDELALSSYDRHRVFRHEDISFTNEVIEQAMEDNEKVLIVCNTVKQAQAVFRDLQERFGQHENMLIHSRFRRKDRSEKERLLREVFEGGPDGGLRPCWVVATQVVEVSLDISFDRMITACAPLDALIQRFGRVNRRRTADALGTLKPVHVIAPEGSQLPYSDEIVKKTFELLPSDGEPLREAALQGLLDELYPELPQSPDISAHTIWRGSQITLPPLHNQAGAILQEMLEISSASCILEEDFEAYENASWDERPEFEIPVSGKAIWHQARKNKYPQSDVGSKPFVVPQSVHEHEEVGLVLKDYSSFL